MATAAPASPAQISAWQRSVGAVGTPGVGCFRASYPTLTWTAARCTAAPDLTLAPGAAGGGLFSADSLSAPATAGPGGAGALTVGDGNDAVAVVTGKISHATGSFTNVSPGITETGIDGANSFSLQLNSEFFSGGPACKKAAVPSECLSWQQFAYTTTDNVAFMQYWLIDYNTTCPSGWFADGGDCYTNSPAVVVGGGPLTAADLASVQLEGKAKASGKDAVVLTFGGEAFTVSNPDSKVALAPHWNTTEFNVFGDGGGSAADFGANTSLEARTAITASVKQTPTCTLGKGYTAETNNLTMTATPSLGTTSTPTIASAETNGTTSTASCAAAK